MFCRVPLQRVNTLKQVILLENLSIILDKIISNKPRKGNIKGDTESRSVQAPCLWAPESLASGAVSGSQLASLKLQGQRDLPEAREKGPGPTWNAIRVSVPRTSRRTGTSARRAPRHLCSPEDGPRARLASRVGARSARLDHEVGAPTPPQAGCQRALFKTFPTQRPVAGRLRSQREWVTGPFPLAPTARALPTLGANGRPGQGGRARPLKAPHLGGTPALGWVRAPRPAPSEGAAGPAAFRDPPIPAPGPRPQPRAVGRAPAAYPSARRSGAAGGERARGRDNSSVRWTPCAQRAGRPASSCCGGGGGSSSALGPPADG